MKATATSPAAIDTASDSSDPGRRIAALIRANRVLSKELERLRRFKDLAYQDGLTGLHNRRYLDERLGEETARAARHRRILTLVMIDLDGLKAVNDTEGHQAGDELIVWFAAHLRRNLRGEDVVCRYGGDEFAILMPETTAEHAALLVARLRQSLARRSTRRVTTFGAGIAQYGLGVSPMELLASADAALYEAKRSGRGVTTIFGGVAPPLRRRTDRLRVPERLRERPMPEAAPLPG